jgi:hypothetical protein
MNFVYRFFKYVAGILFFLAIISVGVNHIINQDAVIPPHIDLQKTEISLAAPVHSFPFEQTTITVTSQVDASAYNGAKSADKETRITGNVSDDIWLQKTYLAMINDPNQEQFYNDLIHNLRSNRVQHQLSDDEYLELITVFIQSIPYETKSDSPPKFPIETYVDKSGDCDDKSLLLAGLLSREGYNVSLLSFTPESHMAVGVVCPGGEYKQTGYTFVETTNLSFAGIPTDTLIEGVPLDSDPRVIRVGNGTKIFGSCGEALYLNSVLKSSEKNVSDITAQIDSLKIEMTGYYTKRDAENYNLRVPLFNDLQRKRLLYAELHNYIFNHQYDRKGTYQYVKNTISG